MQDRIITDGKDSTLQEETLGSKHKNNNSFLAIEKGIGKHSRHTNAALNSKIKNKARQWLVKENPTIIFYAENTNETLVDSKECKKSQATTNI